MGKNNAHFVTHPRAKDIVGRGLINDDLIAIIELMKNSKDAQSDYVDVKFSNSDNVEEGEILIVDSGCGMSESDLRTKWLNLAYSEKKKSQHSGKQTYAGNKGIGRFSCDRLGKKLSLYSKKARGKWVKLEIDWTDFEVDEIEKRIEHILVSISEITESVFKKETKLEALSKGSVLKITDLRSIWDFDKLKKLKTELERFIVDPTSTFDVNLSITPDEKKLSGKIENRIFEKLDFRTTSIHVLSVKNGKEIEISLRHDGNIIFTLTEENTYHYIKNISAEIYYLNQPAKAFFKRTTGYRSVEFGSIFLFLNGFRVLPYGQEGNDWLGIDRRKQQGYARNIGTRECVGFIKLNDSDEIFSPISSREGLINNDAFSQLAGEQGLIQKALRKLEKFVVDGLDWDRLIINKSDSQMIAGDYQYVERKSELLQVLDSVISLRSTKDKIKNVEVNSIYLLQLAQENKQAYLDLVETLNKKFDGLSLPELTAPQKRDLSKFVAQQAKELAAKEESIKHLEEKTSTLKKANIEIKHELNVETKKRMYAESHLKPVSVRYGEITHHVGLLSKETRKELKGALKLGNAELKIALEQGNKDRIKNLKAILEKVQASFFHVEKIRKLSKIITKANFDMMSDSKWDNYFNGIEEYITEIMGAGISWGIKVSFKNSENLALKLNFSPLEQAMLIDNILDNAQDAEAKNIIVTVHEDHEFYYLDFCDDGEGLINTYKPEELFSAGITTTKGSGIGLSHIKQIVDGLEGEASIFNNSGKGCTVRVRWKK